MANATIGAQIGIKGTHISKVITQLRRLKLLDGECMRRSKK